MRAIAGTYVADAVVVHPIGEVMALFLQHQSQMQQVCCAVTVTLCQWRTRRGDGFVTGGSRCSHILIAHAPALWCMPRWGSTVRVCDSECTSGALVHVYHTSTLSVQLQELKAAAHKYVYGSVYADDRKLERMSRRLQLLEENLDHFERHLQAKLNDDVRGCFLFFLCTSLFFGTIVMQWSSKKETRACIFGAC